MTDDRVALRTRKLPPAAASAETRKAGRLETTPDDLFEGLREAVNDYEQEGQET